MITTTETVLTFLLLFAIMVMMMTTEIVLTFLLLFVISVGAQRLFRKMR